MVYFLPSIGKFFPNTVCKSVGLGVAEKEKIVYMSDIYFRQRNISHTLRVSDSVSGKIVNI